MTHLTQAARLLAARTGDTIGEAEDAMRAVCEMCGCDVEAAAAALVENVSRDGWREDTAA